MGACNSSSVINEDESSRSKAKSPDENKFGVSSVNEAEMLGYDHGAVPLADVPAILIDEGDFVLWTPVGQGPDPKSKAKRFISLKHNKQVHHFPVIEGPKPKGKTYIQKHKQFPDIDSMVNYYVMKKVPVKQDDPTCLLANGVFHSLIKLVFLSQLGQGNFGEVLKGEMERGGVRTPCAIKRLKENPAKPLTDAAREEFLREARLMRYYKHPNIVRLYCVSFSDRDMFIIMELVEGGTLLKHLQMNESFTPMKNMMKYARDVAAGMAYLESEKCIHRDLAARNCLLTKETKDKQAVKISDFGLSQVGESYKMQDTEKVPWRWTAPEALSDLIYTTKSDVWSFGVLMYEIWSEGRRPYPDYTDSHTLRKDIERGYRLSRPQFMTTYLYSIMLTCFEFEPQARPTFAALLTKFDDIWIDHERRGWDKRKESTSLKGSKDSASMSKDSTWTR